MKRFCLALDLKNDPVLMEEYKQYHRQVWPEILDSIAKAGILQMEIYLIGCRLFMVMETEDNFDPKAKAAMDAANPRVQAWEELMWKYQSALPQARAGEKWIATELIFRFDAVGRG